MAPPIIGMPTLEDAILTFSATCCCERKSPLLVPARVGHIFGCAACRRCWRVNAFSSNPLTGKVDVGLDIVIMNDEGKAM